MTLPGEEMGSGLAEESIQGRRAKRATSLDSNTRNGVLCVHTVHAYALDMYSAWGKLWHTPFYAV